MRISDWRSDVCSSDLSKVCIPQIAEAERMRRRYDRYVNAVHDMALAEPWEAVDTLDPLPQSGTYRVATWIPADQVSSEERRVGKECVSACRSQWSPYT